MPRARLELSREQILAFRRRVGSLNQRMPMGAQSLRCAAWAGLQDSMPRAAQLSIHARVDRANPATWGHPSLVQLWGPRFSSYVIARRDLAVFSLGRPPDDTRRRNKAYETAASLHAVLDGCRIPYGQAGQQLGVHPNSLRYAAPTGSVLMRWDGAKQPVIWTVSAPPLEPQQARLELARRYLHIFGAASPESFATWAGIKPSESRSALSALSGELTPAHTPLGNTWILSDDEAKFRVRPEPPALARLLPSGDTYYLLWSEDRKLLVPEAKQRASLWPTRAWPGALLLGGEISGVWRRSGRVVSIQPWRHLSNPEQKAAEAEAASLPLPGCDAAISIRWT